MPAARRDELLRSHPEYSTMPQTFPIHVPSTSDEISSDHQTLRSIRTHADDCPEFAYIKPRTSEHACQPDSRFIPPFAIYNTLRMYTTPFFVRIYDFDTDTARYDTRLYSSYCRAWMKAADLLWVGESSGLQGAYPGEGHPSCPRARLDVGLRA